MHQCVIAHCPLDDLLSTLGRLSSLFQNVPPGQETIHRRRDGEPILVGEVNGLAYLCEDHGTVFAVCWGLLARVARELDTIVISSTFDPMENQCEFFLVNRGQIVRAWWSNPRRTTRAYSLGEPLASEDEAPLSSPQGTGLKAALRAMGFSLLDQDSFDADRMVTWPGDAGALLEADELRDPVSEHVRTFPNPSYRLPEPKVIVRRLS